MGAQELLESLLSAYKSESSEEAYGAIQSMIGKLGDPYTRMIPARCAASAGNCKHCETWPVTYPERLHSSHPVVPCQNSASGLCIKRPCSVLPFDVYPPSSCQTSLSGSLRTETFSL